MRAIALFLGAGFSKPWGLPVTNELLPVSKEMWIKIVGMFPKRGKMRDADMECKVATQPFQLMFLRILFAFLSDNFSRGLFQAA